MRVPDCLCVLSYLDEWELPCAVMCYSHAPVLNIIFAIIHGRMTVFLSNSDTSSNISMAT